MHKDLNPNNISLDNNLNPNILDFGLVRISGDDEREAKNKESH